MQTQRRDNERMSKLWLSSAFVLSLAACASKDSQDKSSLATSEDAPEMSDVKNLSDSPEAMKTINRFRGRKNTAGKRRAIRTASSPIAINDGLYLNGMYFVRGDNESWQSISKTIYGSDAKSSSLKTWNRATTLTPGSLVYYNSPKRPTDSKNILSFAEDQGMQLESYTVVKDDWLSKIGLSKYGHVESWKEISALNPEITNPDLIEIGQVIKLQPANIVTSNTAAPLAITNTPPTSTGSISDRESDELPPPAPTESTASTDEAQANLATAPPTKTNLFKKYQDYIILVAGVSILGGALFFIRKRRMAAAEEAQRFQEMPTNVAEFPQSRNY